MQKIPKIIHLIWLGGDLPEKFNPLKNKIKEINHDYEIIEWRDNNINFDLKNKKLFDSCENLGAKSDILRFEVLYKFGGIYLDYDFLSVKKFDELLNFDFFAGTGESQPEEIWNSIVGCSKKNQIALNFLNGLSLVSEPIKKWEIDRVMNETGPYYLTKIIKNSNLPYQIFVGDYFFPFPGSKRNQIKNLSDSDYELVKSFITKNTYCVHLHTCSWQ
jgi:mannosyltransferase OCH1-like enzyme